MRLTFAALMFGLGAFTGINFVSIRRTVCFGLCGRLCGARLTCVLVGLCPPSPPVCVRASLLACVCVCVGVGGRVVRNLFEDLRWSEKTP